MKKLKKNDLVEILTGKDKGKKGKVLDIKYTKKLCLVEGINRAKKHMKKTQDHPGGIIDINLPVNTSNVQIICPKCQKAAKIGITPGTVTSEEVGGFSQYSLTIECLGKMRDVINFIYGIESSNKPLQVVAIQIAPKNRQDYEVKCSLTVVKYLVEPDEEL